MNKRLIILDRDGVINRLRPQGVASPQEWEALPGSLEAIARLCRAGYRVVIITNQSGIARGFYSINTLNQIHRKMLDALQSAGGEISAIFFCPHGPDDGCACRKPKPGLFLELADRLKCNLREAYAVGDSIRDLEAARAAGAKPVLVQTGNGRAAARDLKAAPPATPDLQLADVPVHKNLAEFVSVLLASETASPDSDAGADDAADADPNAG